MNSSRETASPVTGGEAGELIEGSDVIGAVVGKDAVVEVMGARRLCDERTDCWKNKQLLMYSQQHKLMRNLRFPQNVKVVFVVVFVL